MLRAVTLGTVPLRFYAPPLTQNFKDLFRATDGFGRYTVRGYGRSYFTAGFGRYTIRLYGRSSFMAETVPTLRTRNFTAIQKNPDSGN